MKVKEESEKVGLKLNIQKTKIMTSGPIISCQIHGETREILTHCFSLAPKLLTMVTAAMKLKDACSLEKSCDKPRQHIKKQRHHFAEKGLYSPSFGLSSSHVWMWELDYKKGWKCYSFSHVDSLRPHGLYGSWNSWNSPGQNTGVGSLSLLQGIFPTQGWNPGLPHCRQILYQLSHKKSPRILEWVAYPFYRGSSWPRNWTRVSWIVGRFFTSWATREALYLSLGLVKTEEKGRNWYFSQWMKGYSFVRYILDCELLEDKGNILGKSWRC